MKVLAVASREQGSNTTYAEVHRHIESFYILTINHSNWHSFQNKKIPSTAEDVQYWGTEGCSVAT